MKSYKDFIVWQKSITLVKEIYNLTENFPDAEKFGLTNQMRRCSVSIPSNIAEGFGRKNRKDNARFIAMAYGSAMELETQLIISKKLNFTNNNLIIINKLLDEILRMLYKYRESLLKAEY